VREPATSISPFPAASTGATRLRRRASAFSDLFEFEMIDLADMAEVDPFVASTPT